MLQISKAQLEQAIKNAKTAIIFEDDDFQKQYYRGVKDTLQNLLDKANKNIIVETAK
jgi:hypothetical protein